jgi:hypothetical protein
LQRKMSSPKIFLCAVRAPMGRSSKKRGQVACKFCPVNKLLIAVRGKEFLQGRVAA